MSELRLDEENGFFENTSDQQRIFTIKTSIIIGIQENANPAPATGFLMKDKARMATVQLKRIVKTTRTWCKPPICNVRPRTNAGMLCRRIHQN